MKRKGLISLLSCVLALLLPLGALAQSAAIDLLDKAKTDGKEIVTTVTFEPGETLAKDQTVSEMSAATAIRLNKLPGGFGALTISLQGKDTIAAQVHVLPDGIYIQNETLGDKPLYFSWVDLNSYITSLMKASGTDAAQIQQFNEGFTTAIEQVFAAGTLTGATPPTEFTKEMAFERITQAMNGDDGFVKWIQEIEATKVVTTGEFTLGDSDKADTKTDIIVTKEELTKLFDIKYFQTQIANSLKSQDSTLTAEQLDAKTKETVEKNKSSLLASNSSIPITLYSIGENEVVAVEANYTGLILKNTEIDTTVATALTTDAAQPTATATATATEAVPTQAAIHAQYTRKSLASGKLYTFVMSATEDEKALFDATGSLTVDDKKTTGTFSVTNGTAKMFQMDLTSDYTDAKAVSGQVGMTILDPQSPIALLINLQQKVGDAGFDTALSLSSGTTMDALTASPAASLLGTLKVNTVIQDDSGLFNALKEATPETSILPLKMNNTEMNSFLSTLQSNAIQLAYKVLANLPPNVAKLLSGSMMSK